MTEPACRACRSRVGDLVLDLGDQPACDYFPRHDDPGPDPVYPLQMWLCAHCGLAQLVGDHTEPEEPRGAEPAALVEQAADAVRRASRAGLLPRGAGVAEYGSPHGGSWLALLQRRGLHSVEDGGQAAVVLDCFGMMHCADQFAALARRTAQVAKGGVLLLQYHSLATILRCGQWNALRHGHYAYYSTPALAGMLAVHGFSPRTAWRFDLYGGTVLLVAARDADGPRSATPQVRRLQAEEDEAGARDANSLRSLERDASARAKGLADWLSAERAAGHSVLGYGAASRAVALLVKAGARRELLPAVVDSSPAKHGLRIPGTDIPIASPDLLARYPAATVLLFVPDLLQEVRATFLQVEASGGKWVIADGLGT